MLPLHHSPELPHVFTDVARPSLVAISDTAIEHDSTPFSDTAVRPDLSFHRRTINPILPNPKNLPSRILISLFTSSGQQGRWV